MAPIQVCLDSAYANGAVPSEPRAFEMVRVPFQMCARSRSDGAHSSVPGLGVRERGAVPSEPRAEWARAHSRVRA